MMANDIMGDEDAKTPIERDCMEGPGNKLANLDYLVFGIFSSDGYGPYVISTTMRQSPYYG